MKKRSKSSGADENQQQLAFFVPMVMVPQGGGEFLLKPGKAVQWLSTQQMAREFHCNEDTISRWRMEGVIPMDVYAAGLKKVPAGKKLEDVLLPEDELARKRGLRAWEYAAELIPILRAKLRSIDE